MPLSYIARVNVVEHNLDSNDIGHSVLVVGAPPVVNASAKTRYCTLFVAHASTMLFAYSLGPPVFCCETQAWRSSKRDARVYRPLGGERALCEGSCVRHYAKTRVSIEVAGFRLFCFLKYGTP